MNNVTLKQILSLLLMAAAMALILVLMPDHASTPGQSANHTSLIKQAIR
jgi:hypothetical protein